MNIDVWISLFEAICPFMSILAKMPYKGAHN